MFQHEVEPDAGTASVAFHKGVSDIHFHVLVDDFLEGGLRHIFDIWQNCVEIESIGERETAFADVFGTDLTGEVIESAEDVGVDLLKTFDRAGVKRGKQAAFKEGISFFLALTVDGIIAVKEPVKELCRFIIRKVLCQLNDTETIETVGQAFFTVWSSQFQLVSGTNQLRIFLFQFVFEVLPVVAVLGVIRLLIQHSDNIDGSKEPLGRAFIPSRPDFPVIKESDGYFGHNLFPIAAADIDQIPRIS